MDDASRAVCANFAGYVASIVDLCIHIYQPANRRSAADLLTDGPTKVSHAFTSSGPVRAPLTGPVFHVERSALALLGEHDKPAARAFDKRNTSRKDQWIGLEVGRRILSARLKPEQLAA